ncbi:MAG: protein tyrosine phosphatase [Beijerinckiaceae bacterium]
MPRLHVCPLRMIDDVVAESGARSMVTLINVGTPVTRPALIDSSRHLFIGMSDILAPAQGHVAPDVEHVEKLLTFVRAWDRADPLLIHCWAGVSRSTAAAFASACALRPERSEVEIARAIRTASPTATPNARFVAVADDILGRKGRMVDAVAAIGRGVDCFEGVPFALPV